MQYYLVEFACYPKDEIKMYLLDENKHDDWCECEPQQGYKHFKTIWCGELEQIVLRDRENLPFVIVSP